MHPMNTLVEVSLVETVQVGKMDLHPPQTTLSERLGFLKEKQATRQVVTDVVQMRRERVGAASEIEVVREVDGLVEELL